MPEFLSHGFPLRQESMMLCQASPVALLGKGEGGTIRDLGTWTWAPGLDMDILWGYLHGGPELDWHEFKF